MHDQNRINYYSWQSALAPRDNEQTGRAVPQVVEPSNLRFHSPSLHQYLDGNIPELGCGETEKQHLGIREELIKNRVYVVNECLPEFASIANFHHKKAALKPMLKLVKPCGALIVSRSRQLREGQHTIPPNEIAALCNKMNQDPAFSLEGVAEHSCRASRMTPGEQLFM